MKIKESTIRDIVREKSSIKLLVQETYNQTIEAEKWDIFLSHSKKDEELLIGAAEFLRSKGFTVYVDWVYDIQLNRSDVNIDTALKLQERMQNCKMMIYLHTVNSGNSKWCPWELGYFDGCHNGNVFRMPLTDDEGNVGNQEYLALYPYVDLNRYNEILYVYTTSGDNIQLSEAKQKSFK